MSKNRSARGRTVVSKRTNDFQTLIYLVHSQLAPRGAKVVESDPVYDGAHILREVDITIEQSIAGVARKAVIECRDRSRAASVQWIDEMVGKYQGADVSSITAVSKAGFSDNATKKAQHAGIRVLALERAISTNWVQYFKGARVRLVTDAPEFAGVHVGLVDKSVDLTELVAEKQLLIKSDGTSAGNPLDFFTRVVWPKAGNGTRQLTPNAEGMVFIAIKTVGISLRLEDARELPLESITYTVKLNKETAEIELAPHRYGDHDIATGVGKTGVLTAHATAVKHEDQAKWLIRLSSSTEDMPKGSLVVQGLDNVGFQPGPLKDAQ